MKVLIGSQSYTTEKSIGRTDPVINIFIDPQGLFYNATSRYPRAATGQLMQVLKICRMKVLMDS